MRHQRHIAGQKYRKQHAVRNFKRQKNKAAATCDSLEFINSLLTICNSVICEPDGQAVQNNVSPKRHNLICQIHTQLPSQNSNPDKVRLTNTHYR